MATASLTNTPTLIDDGSSASLTVVNTGATEVTVLREWASRVILRPGRDVDVIPAGRVTAFVNPAQGTTGAVTYYAKAVDPASSGPATVDTNELAPGLIIDGGTP